MLRMIRTIRMNYHTTYHTLRYHSQCFCYDDILYKYEQFLEENQFTLSITGIQFKQNI